MRDHNLMLRNATFHFIIEPYLHIFNKTVDDVNAESYEKVELYESCNKYAYEQMIIRNKNVTLLEFISANIKIYAVAID